MKVIIYENMDIEQGVVFQAKSEKKLLDDVGRYLFKSHGDGAMVTEPINGGHVVLVWAESEGVWEIHHWPGDDFSESYTVLKEYPTLESALAEFMKYVKQAAWGRGWIGWDQ